MIAPGDDKGGFDETRPYSTLSPGTRISHFEILEKIGEGGMGVVYKARDTKLERIVALKFLPPQLLCENEARERFKREARASSAVSHPNLATIYEVDEAEARCFISMEYLEGGSLRKLLAKEVPLRKILDLALQVSEGLAAAHESGVVHRDLKPDNVMLSRRGLAKVTDFGLAKLKGTARVTREGTTLGTLPYMSPEQVQGLETDRRSDIFSLGVILYEMIAGRLPFRGDNEAAIINAILHDIPEPLPRYRSGVPDGLQRVVEKALAKDPAERYQHAEDLSADLRHEKRLLETESSLVTAAVGQGRAQGQDSVAATSRNRLLKILIPAVVIAIAAVLLLVFQPFRLGIGPGDQASAQANSLAILYFENMVNAEDPGRTAEMITTLLITDLSESEFMYVISRQRLYDILKTLGKQDLKTVDMSVASEVARRAGAKWILTGSILQTSPNIVLASSISEAATGRVLATQKITGNPDEDLFAVVDRLSAEVRQDLSLPKAGTLETDRPVAEMTTHSPEAYRYYLNGIDLSLKSYSLDAVKSFEQAVAMDSTFAIAYYYLARELMGPESPGLIAKAYQYRDHATERERYLIRSLYAAYSGDNVKATEILKEAAKRYPDDKEIHFELALSYSGAFGAPTLEACIEELLRTIELDPHYKQAYNQLAYSYHDAGDFEKSIWAINRYVALAPDEANPYDSRGDLYAYNGKLDDAIVSYLQAISIKPDFWPSIMKLGAMRLFLGDYEKAEGYFRKLVGNPDAEVRSAGRYGLALIPAHQGRFLEALKMLDDGMAADRMEGFEGGYFADKHRVKVYLCVIRGEYDLALDEAEAYREVRNELRPILGTYAEPLCVLTMSQAGMVAEAEARTEKLKAVLSQGSKGDMAWYWMARGYLAWGQGDAAQTAECLEHVATIDPAVARYTRYALGECYLKLGRLADAVSELEKQLKIYDLYRASIPTYIIRDHYLLGLAYEKSGWTDKAIEQYEVFLEIWKDADPGIPEIDDARKRLAALKPGS